MPNCDRAHTAATGGIASGILAFAFTASLPQPLNWTDWVSDDFPRSAALYGDAFNPKKTGFYTPTLVPVDWVKEQEYVDTVSINSSSKSLSGRLESLLAQLSEHEEIVSPDASVERTAKMFINGLPMDVITQASPDFLYSEDGELGLSWKTKGGVCLSFWFEKNGEVIYASTSPDGKNDSCGEFDVRDGIIPRAIHTLIDTVLSA